MAAAVPYRQVRANHDDDTITVYQAYPPGIADAALAAGTFLAPFKRERMTWIKPSFLWMMYRSGWAMKPGQERVLAVTVSRAGFEWALAHSCLSHFEPGVYTSEQQWAECKLASPVRIQWDPERSLTLDPLHYRTIQIGLHHEAARRYAAEWVADIIDVTSLAQEIHDLLRAKEEQAAHALLPDEQPYTLSDQVRQVIGAS
jgi:hypothetical protein